MEPLRRSRRRNIRAKYGNDKCIKAFIIAPVALLKTSCCHKIEGNAHVCNLLNSALYEMPCPGAAA